MIATAPAHTRYASPSHSPFDGKLYQYHGMTVLDADGQVAGQIDWIWSDESGTYLGIGLRWLRGTSHAVPVDDLRIDRVSGTVQVAYTKAQMVHAPRFSITGPLGAKGRAAIRAHYSPSLHTLPAMLANRRAA